MKQSENMLFAFSVQCADFCRMDSKMAFSSSFREKKLNLKAELPVGATLPRLHDVGIVSDRSKLITPPYGGDGGGRYFTRYPE